MSYMHWNVMKSSAQCFYVCEFSSQWFYFLIQNVSLVINWVALKVVGYPMLTHGQNFECILSYVKIKWLILKVCIDNYDRLALKENWIFLFFLQCTHSIYININNSNIYSSFFFWKFMETHVNLFLKLALSPCSNSQP
jgi:hypothetical protein